MQKISDPFEDIRSHCDMFKGYYYLASPYTSKYRSKRIDRYLSAIHAMHVLMSKKIVVFGPIAHTHPIATKYHLPKDSDYWNAYDDAFVTHSIGMIMLLLDGWQESKGMKHELDLVKCRGSYPLYTMTEMTIDDETVFDLKRMETNIFER